MESSSEKTGEVIPIITMPLVAVGSLDNINM
jgi:hypothetical protein